MAIFDATNSTAERRQYLINRFHGKVQYLFIESLCTDADTIRKNTELKLKYSPDYVDMDPAEVRQPVDLGKRCLTLTFLGRRRFASARSLPSDLCQVLKSVSE